MKAEIYFSNKCQHCQKILHMLEEKNVLHKFQLVCVDDLTLEKLQKLSIAIVPTIVTTIDDVRIGTYETKDAFKFAEWICK